MSDRGRFAAILDANVLYSAAQRDLLMELAVAPLYHARWTERIEQEFVKAILKNRPDLSAETLAYTITCMRKAVDDCLIADYEWAEEGLNLPDPDDHHVLAAAVAGQCDVIVTNNLKDFPAKSLPRGIAALSPDDFILNLHDLAPRRIEAAVLAVVDRGDNRTIERVLATYENQGLVKTVNALRKSDNLW